MKRQTILGVSLLAVTCGTTIGLACNDSATKESCYERSAGLDWDGRPEHTPYCDWPVGGLPDPPERYANTWKVLVTFEPNESAPCDPCDVERFDALLEAQVREQCDQPFELVRGCYWPVEEQPAGQCVVYGLYHTNCDAPTVE